VTKARVEAKRAALDALRPSITSATYPCLVAYTAPNLFALTVGGPAGAVASAMVGSVMLSISAPLCAQWVRVVYDEISTVRDPPRSDYQRVARVSRAAVEAKLPPCSKFDSSQRTPCKRIEAAAAAYLTAVGRVASVSTAIHTTVERDTAAEKAGKTSALATQERALEQLQGQLAAAQKARRSAGAVFAAALRAAKVTIMLNQSQAAMGLAAITAKAKSLGLDQTTLSSVAGSRLAPQPIDAIAALTR
jgi:hypothetical protein